MALTYNAAEQFYRTILLSMHGEDCIWIDENGTETNIRASIRRGGVGYTSLPRTNTKLSPSKQRGYTVYIANSDLYGRTGIKLGKEKIKFKLNVTESVYHTATIISVEVSDQAKWGLRCQL